MPFKKIIAAVGHDIKKHEAPTEVYYKLTEVLFIPEIIIDLSVRTSHIKTLRRKSGIFES